MTKVIDIAKDFSRYPAGRYLDDGPFNGQLFRDSFLVPALNSGEGVEICFDGARGYGSSFLEEAFGGLCRAGYKKEKIEDVFDFKSSDPSLVLEVKEYINNACS